jgi:hypothetical protein
MLRTIDMNCSRAFLLSYCVKGDIFLLFFHVGKPMFVKSDGFVTYVFSRYFIVTQGGIRSDWCRVSDPHHFFADPDPAFHFGADPAPHQGDAYLLPLAYRPSILYFLSVHGPPTAQY